MELLPLGPVLFIDTPGIDDEGTLGSLRVQRSYQTLNKTDIAVLVVEAASGLSPEDWALLDKIREKKLPALLVFTQADHLGDPAAWEERIPDLKRVKATNIPYCIVSSATGKKYNRPERNAGAPRSGKTGSLPALCRPRFPPGILPCSSFPSTRLHRKAG
jgi:predicted GTPase